MNTILTVNGVSYNAAQRAAASIVLNEMIIHLDEYDTFAFGEISGQPTPSFKFGWPVSVTTDGTLRFSGFATDIQSSGDGSWSHGYLCNGLRWFCDRYIPVTGEDGSGSLELDTPPDDVFSFSTDRGLTIGQILTRLFTIEATATALSAAGVQYASLTPPTLPGTTVADFALLNVVPAQSAIFQGPGIFAQASQFISRWMPRFALQLQPDGTIRAKDTTDTTTAFPPRTFTLASAFGAGDPIKPFPSIKGSIANCATNVAVRGGPEVEGSLLSLVDGTLAEGFTSTDKTNWNYSYFENPKDGEDRGSVVSCTSTSATIQSASSGETWTTNFWAGRAGTIFLINQLTTTPLASISPYTMRQVTSCGAMSAGGTTTVNWDSSWPTAEMDFNTYRIVAGIGGMENVWRLYLARDPGTGNTGLNTKIGQNLVYQSAVPIKWSNKSATIGENFAQGVVVGAGGSSWPLGVTPIPSLGGYMFIQPTVSVWGNPQNLLAGSPTTVAAGLPADVQIFALYSIGALTTVYPPAGTGGVTTYSGTAAATWKVTQTIDVPSWTWGAETADMTTLAEEHFKTMSDIEYDVSLNWLVNSAGHVPSWSFLDFAWSLNVAIAGATSPWSAINCPIRSIRIAWQGTPNPQVITFTASNKKKPFTGDELYTHPQFAGVSALGGIGQGGGEYGAASSGLMDIAKYMGGAGSQSNESVQHMKEMQQDKVIRATHPQEVAAAEEAMGGGAFGVRENQAFGMEGFGMDDGPAMNGRPKRQRPRSTVADRRKNEHAWNDSLGPATGGKSIDMTDDPLGPATGGKSIAMGESAADEES